MFGMEKMHREISFTLGERIRTKVEIGLAIYKFPKI